MIDLLNYALDDDEFRSRNIFKLGGESERYTEIFEPQWSVFESETSSSGYYWYEALLVFRQNDGSDYFMIVYMDSVVPEACSDLDFLCSRGTHEVHDYQYRLDHSDLVEVLGVSWALDTDYYTAYYTDESLPARVYFRDQND